VIQNTTNVKLIIFKTKIFFFLFTESYNQLTHFFESYNIYLIKTEMIEIYLQIDFQLHLRSHLKNQ